MTRWARCGSGARTAWSPAAVWAASVCSVVAREATSRRTGALRFRTRSRPLVGPAAWISGLLEISDVPLQQGRQGDTAEGGDRATCGEAAHSAGRACVEAECGPPPEGADGREPPPPPPR